MSLNHSKNYIIYQAYGKEQILQECLFSLLSLAHVATPTNLQNLEIWVYTDNQEWFSKFKNCPLPLHYKTISQAQIKKWKGTIDFVHRVKIEILLDFSSDFKGNILYLDTDTFFLQSPQTLFDTIENGGLCMHLNEGSITTKSPNRIFRKVANYFIKNNKYQLEGSIENIQFPMSMYNAGVLGFQSHQNCLLKDVLSFTDINYVHFRNHVVEQFAFTLFFSSQKQIAKASSQILHYWNLKELRIILDSFFNFYLPDWQVLLDKKEQIIIPHLLQEKMNFYVNRSIYKKIKKQNWAIEIPEWIS